MNYKLLSAITQNILCHFPMVDGNYSCPPGFEDLVLLESDRMPSRTWLNTNDYNGVDVTEKNINGFKHHYLVIELFKLPV